MVSKRCAIYIPFVGCFTAHQLLGAKKWCTVNPPAFLVIFPQKRRKSTCYLRGFHGATSQNPGCSDGPFECCFGNVRNVFGDGTARIQGKIQQGFGDQDCRPCELGYVHTHRVGPKNSGIRRRVIITPLVSRWKKTPVKPIFWPYNRGSNVTPFIPIGLGPSLYDTWNFVEWTEWTDSFNVQRMGFITDGNRHHFCNLHPKITEWVQPFWLVCFSPPNLVFA